MTDLNKLVARLEKVNEQLAEKQTDALRKEQDTLMRKLQQARQKDREAALAAGDQPEGPAPGTLSSGATVNGE